jgi:hypothetical protein
MTAACGLRPSTLGYTLADCESASRQAYTLSIVRLVGANGHPQSYEAGTPNWILLALFSRKQSSLPHRIQH